MQESSQRNTPSGELANDQRAEDDSGEAEFESEGESSSLLIRGPELVQEENADSRVDDLISHVSNLTI